MRTLSTLWLVLLILIVPVSVCVAEGVDVELTSTEAEAGETDDAADDWAATIAIRSGVLWNLDREEWTGYVNFPFLTYREVTFEAGFEVNPNEKEGKTGAILALTYDLGNLRDFGVNVSWAEHFGVNVGPFLRYDLADGGIQKGVLVSVVDFSKVD